MASFSEAFEKCPLVAILRGIEPEEVIEIGVILTKAGFTLIEVPLNSPEPLISIQKLSETFGDKVVIGAGTVLNIDEVGDVAKAGGKMIVSPNTNIDIIIKTKSLNLISIPGFATTTEAFTAVKAGADALKLFPAEGSPPSVLKAMSAVLPQNIPVLPVGGIEPGNISEYVSSGARGFGIGSFLYKRGKDLDKLSRDAALIISEWNASHSIS